MTNNQRPTTTSSVFRTSDKRPHARDIHFLDRDRLELRLREERGKIEIRLEADVHGEGRDDPFDAREYGILAAEVIEDDNAAARTADAAHLARDGDRIGNDADHVRRVHDLETVVGEFQVGRVHLQEPHVAHVFARDPFARFFEHRAGQVDARHGTVARVERGVDAGTDAYLEHAVAGPD